MWNVVRSSKVHNRRAAGSEDARELIAGREICHDTAHGPADLQTLPRTFERAIKNPAQMWLVVSHNGETEPFGIRVLRLRSMNAEVLFMS
jgi:hypothetical protein